VSHLFIITICAVASLLLSSIQVNAETPRLSLEALINEALERNSDLTVLRERLEAERHRVPQAGALMDPTFKVDFSNVPLNELDFDSSPMSGIQLTLSQRLPYWGKREARERMVEHTVAVTEAIYEDRQGVIVNLVKQSYFALAFLDRAIEITRENEALLRDFIRIAQSKYSVGTGLQQDVLKAQVALSSLKDDMIQLRRRRGHAEAELNAVLNQSPQRPLGGVETPLPSPFTYETEDLQRMALERRPALRQLRAQVLHWQAAEDLARADHRPDFDLSVGYRQRSFANDPVGGSDFVSVAVAANLPVYTGRKQDQRSAETRARRAAAEAEFEARRLRIFLEIQKLAVDIQAHQEQTALFKTAIIPQAEQSLTASMAGYQVDKVDFLTLLNSQVSLLNFEIGYFRHRMAYEKSLAQVEAVVGARLFGPHASRPVQRK
jgi:cobalt-zinc-cadmium efflux system outer membrane protein